MRVVDERADRVVHRRHARTSRRARRSRRRACPASGCRCARRGRRRARPRSSRTRARRGRSAPSSPPTPRRARAPARCRSRARCRSSRASCRTDGRRSSCRRRSTGSAGSRRPAAARSRASRAPSAARCRARPRRCTPASAIIASSSSASELQCTKVIVGPSRPLLGELRDRPVAAPLAVADVAADADAELVAPAPSRAAVTSIVANWLPRGARHSVTQRVVRLAAAPRGGGAHRRPGAPAMLTGCQWRWPPPWPKTTRAPDSTSASIAASVCSGVFRLCDQSSSVVIPESSASSVPIRLPA